MSHGRAVCTLNCPLPGSRKAGRPLRRSLPILVILAALTLAACAQGRASSGTPTPPPATPSPAAPKLSIFRGFVFPIEGACLPKSDNLMPGAARAYRDGIHEGIDFYQVDNCTKIGKGTPVRAAKDGTVIRADQSYHDLTPAELAAADKAIAAGRANDPALALIDLFRGRQVWVDHGDGIVTRYAHLSAIPTEIQVGRKVVQGETIAFVGDSGTPESIADPASEMHLHFELRVGDSYLGRGLPPAQVRTLYDNLFAPWPPS
ncbi:MAG: M23 family metallopeptidase [Chloroflexota bacterium]|nr:M23 family metallopeptidase [Chloroflexota bacterium]